MDNASINRELLVGFSFIEFTSEKRKRREENEEEKLRK